MWDDDQPAWWDSQQKIGEKDKHQTVGDLIHPAPTLWGVREEGAVDKIKTDKEMKEERENTEKEISRCDVPGKVTPKMHSYKYQKKHAEDNKQFCDTYGSTKANMDNWWEKYTGRTRFDKPTKVSSQKQSRADKTRPAKPESMILSKLRTDGSTSTTASNSQGGKTNPDKPPTSERRKSR